MNPRRGQLQARNKLLELQKQKLAIELQIRAWLRVLEGCDTLAQHDDCQELDAPPELEPLGFAGAIRDILRHSAIPLFPTEIRDHLAASGITGRSPGSLWRNIHAVLNRLLEGKEIEEITPGAGQKSYRWINALRRALMAETSAPESRPENTPPAGSFDPRL